MFTRTHDERGRDDSADDRVMKAAMRFLSIIALLVIATLASIVWLSVPFGALWIGAVAVLALVVGAALQRQTHTNTRGRRHREAT